MKLKSALFCCALLSMPTLNAEAIPAMDGIFEPAEWAGYYTDGNDTVGPGIGGQAYDAERLGLFFDNSMVYFGLQTGFDLANGRDYFSLHFAPGDIAIDVNGDSTYEYAIDFTISGSSVLYTLVDMTLPGSSWNLPYYPQHAAAAGYFDATYSAANIAGNFEGAYGDFAPGERIEDDNLNADTELFYSNVIEGSFDLSLLSLYSGGPMKMHWTMGCGNDIINHTSEQAPIPEPATMLLFGSGLVGLAGMARKKIRK